MKGLSRLKTVNDFLRARIKKVVLKYLTTAIVLFCSTSLLKYNLD
jgi:hypothetical protein